MRADPFGALPACSRSVCVLARSAASGRCSSSSTTTTTGQSVSRLPVRGHGQRNALPAGLSDGKSPLPPAPRSPRPPLQLRFCGDGCALSSRSWLRPAPVAEAAAPPLLACLCVGPGDGGAAGGGVGQQLNRRQSGGRRLPDKRHFVCERSRRPDCPPFNKNPSVTTKTPTSANHGSNLTFTEPTHRR